MVTSQLGVKKKEEKGNMNTQDKVINDLAIQLANKTIECANYKALYEETQAQLQQLQAEAQEQTEKEEQ
jgi:uncharacterized protein involved in exopolysaccharide biosynthesis